MMHFRVFGDYVFSPIPNAFNVRTGWWLSKRNCAYAMYCFSASTEKEVEYQLSEDARKGYIKAFEDHVGGPESQTFYEVVAASAYFGDDEVYGGVGKKAFVSFHEACNHAHKLARKQAEELRKEGYGDVDIEYSGDNVVVSSPGKSDFRIVFSVVKQTF